MQWEWEQARLIAMKAPKTPKDIYSSKRYEDLHFAICQHGSGMHRVFWDMMVDAGFSKKQIFTKYMKVLRNVSQVNNDILNVMGVRHFSFQADKK